MYDDIKALLNDSLKLTRDLLLVPFLIISTSNLRYNRRHTIFVTRINKV